MQYCKRCGVTVRNPHKKCPLCQGILEGEGEEKDRMFPNLNGESSRFHRGFRLFTFVCAAVIILAVAVNWAYGMEDFWSRYVLAGAACTWILTAVALAKRRNMMKNFIWQMCLLWGVFLFWDWMTGWNGWAVDYALPVVWLAATLSILLVVWITRPPLSYYMIYLILAYLGSLVLLILLLCKAVKFQLPSIISVAGGFLLLCAMILFQGRMMMEELKKKMHL